MRASLYSGSSSAPPSFVSTSRPNLPAAVASPIDGFERMRIESAGGSAPKTDEHPPRTVSPEARSTRSPSGDELMAESEERQAPTADNSTDSSQQHGTPPTMSATIDANTVTPLSSSAISSISPPPSQPRIPSGIFKRTFMDPSGFLLPPVSNPDLTPHLERADSFWVGDESIRIEAGEQTLEQHWEKQQLRAAQQAKDASTPDHAHLPIATSKTKSIYASALQPRGANTSPEQVHLIDEDDWASVLDATVLVAHHELSQPLPAARASPASITLMPSATTNWPLPHHARTSSEDLSLKRKHQPDTHRARHKQMRVVVVPERSELTSAVTDAAAAAAVAAATAVYSPASAPVTNLTPPQSSPSHFLHPLPTTQTAEPYPGSHSCTTGDSAAASNSSMPRHAAGRSSSPQSMQID